MGASASVTDLPLGDLYQKEHTVRKADEIRSQKMEDWTVSQWGEYMEGKTELE
jgi:hypothetical protein